jgi:hypothetical protein
VNDPWQDTFLKYLQESMSTLKLDFLLTAAAQAADRELAGLIGVCFYCNTSIQDQMRHLPWCIHHPQFHRAQGCDNPPPHDGDSRQMPTGSRRQNQPTLVPGSSDTGT